MIVVPLRVSERQTILNKIESHYKDFLVCSYCISQNQLSKISSKLKCKKISNSRSLSLNGKKAQIIRKDFCVRVPLLIRGVCSRMRNNVKIIKLPG